MSAEPMAQGYGPDEPGIHAYERGSAPASGGNRPALFVEHQIRQTSGGLGHSSDRSPGFVA